MTVAAPTWNDPSRYRFQGALAGRANYDEVQQFLTDHQDVIPSETWATSFEGRTISRIDIGEGPTQIALWSQMHGDEPTHTVVLLELLHTLAYAPPPWAQAILKGCRLSIIPMLNPDGAQRWSRFNAQDIDINRDARRLATPEGQSLRRFIQEGSFDFAFNLHNQNARTCVTPGKSAAVSLLVPPVDLVETDTPSVIRAKRLGSCLVEALCPHCGGMLSRYDADFMPRCFGEWVQGCDVSTLLIEAGGHAGKDVAWLLDLHYYGLTYALWAIAGRGWESHGVAGYESLPRSSPHADFDLLVSRCRLAPGESVVDLGICFGEESVETLRSAAGKFVDIGDLEVNGGHMAIPGEGLTAVPGRVTIVEGLDVQSPAGWKLDGFAAQGVTTVLVPVELDQLSELVGRLRALPLLINIGVMAKTDLAKLQEPAMALPNRGGLRRHEVADFSLVQEDSSICHVVVGGQVVFSLDQPVVQDAGRVIVVDPK